MQPPLRFTSPENNRRPLRRQTPISIQFLRVVVWLSPTMALIAASAIAFYFGGGALFVPPVGLVVAVIAGCFDAILSRAVPVTNSKPDLQPLFRHCIRYVCIQIIFAPVLLVGAVIFLLFADTFI